MIPSRGTARDTIGWRWELLVLTVTLAVVVALTLMGALSSGWNSPRPASPPDWTAASLPKRLEVGQDAASVSLLGHRASDMTFEVVALPLDGPESGLYEYGLVYRAQDAAHYYTFAVGADGYYAVFRTDGEHVHSLVPWRRFPHVRRDRAVNRLLVTCEGASCTFRINHEYATTVEDDRWLSGDVGLWARSLEEEAVLQFSAARLWASDR